MEQGLEPSIKQPCLCIVNTHVYTQRDSQILYNAEAYDTSRNLEFGCGHPLFPAKWRETKFRELSQRRVACWIQGHFEKSPSRQKLWLSPPLALQDKFCLLQTRLNRMDHCPTWLNCSSLDLIAGLTAKRGARKRMDGLNVPFHFRGEERSGDFCTHTYALGGCGRCWVHP